MRYGSAVTIDGKYTEKLDDGGERLQLLDDDGNAILDFEYDDAWYPQTDGDGYTLVMVDPGHCAGDMGLGRELAADAAWAVRPPTDGRPPTNQPPTVSGGPRVGRHLSNTRDGDGDDCR